MIANIRERQPGYNLITNNCQTYALKLLDAIKAGVKKEFATTRPVYERLTGPGAVADLFAAQAEQEHESIEGQTGQNTVLLAQQVMHDNTNQLDTKDEGGRSQDEGVRSAEVPEEPKRSFFSRFRKK